MGYADLVEHDDLCGSVAFRVKDDNYSTFYKVHVQQYKDAKNMSLRCACPYNLGDICRHEVAALLRLQELLDKGMLHSEDVTYDQRHTVAKMKTIDPKTVRLLSSPAIIAEAEAWLRTGKPKIESAAEELVKANVSINGEKYYVILRKNEERNFDTASDYVDEAHLLCLPKVIVFLYLLQKHGPHYFDTIRNWDKEKNKLLEAYGYSLKDDLKGKFEFSYKEGKPFLRVLDASIKRVAPAAAPVAPREETIVDVDEEAPPQADKVSGHVGI